MKKITFFLMMLLSITAFSQVEIVENFDNAPDFDVPAGWTQTGGFGASAGVTCGGSGKAVSVNQYPDGITPAIATLTSPNYPTITNASELTVSFSVNVYTEGGIGWPPPPAAPIDPWGSVTMEYSLDGGSNWIPGVTVDDSNFTFVSFNTCYSVPATDLGVLAAGSDFQARFVAFAETTNWVLSVVIDNISIVQVATAVPNCDATLISPTNDVNLTDTLTWSAATGLPTGYNISIGTSTGDNDILDASTTDTSYSLAGLGLEFETEYFVNIVPFNGIGAATGCTEQSFTTRVTPVDGATCSKPFVVTLDTPYFSTENTGDFENNLNEITNYCFGYSTAYIQGYDVFYEIIPATDISINIDLLVTGNAGAFHVFNGCPDSATAECVGSAGGEASNTLSELVLHAGNTYYVVVSSHGYDSTIDYTLIITKNNCINPEMTLTPVPNCGAGNFTIDVDVTYLGLASSLTLSYGANSQTITSTGVVNVGPFPSGATPFLTLTNDDNTNCYFEAETFYFCPPANDDCGDSIALTVNTDENCTAYYSGTNAGASENAANPIYCEAGFSNTNDVWYSFVATNETIILEYSNIVGVIGVEDDYNKVQSTELLSGDCGTFTNLECFRSNYVVLNNLTINNTYYIRNSSRSTDVAHTYDICLRLPTTPPANDECSGAIALTLSTDNTCNNATAGTTLGATTSSDNSCNDQYSENWGDVWYVFTAPNAGLFQFSFSRDGFDPNANYMIYSGTCGALVAESSNCNGNEYNPQVHEMENGQSLHIMVRAAQTAPSLDFELCVFQLPDPAANNSCSSPTTLLESIDINGNNSISGNFADSYPSPEASCDLYAQSIWYSFTPTYTGLYNFGFTQTNGYPNYTIYNTGDCSLTSNNTVPGTYCYNSGALSANLVGGNTYLISVFSYNDTDSFDLFAYPDATLNVEVNNFEKFKYYPNPVINTLTIEAKNNISSVSVYNILGQQVQMVKPNNLKSTIDMNNLINGVYFVTITIDGSQKTIKVIKK